MGSLPDKADFRSICEAYGNRCLRCGSEGPLTRDHVQPKSRGGDESLANMQPLCRSCNSKKGVRDTDYRPGAEVNQAHFILGFYLGRSR